MLVCSLLLRSSRKVFLLFFLVCLLKTVLNVINDLLVFFEVVNKYSCILEAAFIFVGVFFMLFY